MDLPASFSEIKFKYGGFNPIPPWEGGGGAFDEGANFE